MSGTVLLDWIESPRADRWMRFATDRGREWESYGYDEIAARCRSAAVTLRDRGCEPGSGTAIVLPTGPDFVAALFGSLAAGLTPTPIAPPGFFQSPSEYATHLARVLAIARPAAVITDDDLMGVTADACRQAGLDLAPSTLADPSAGDCRPAPPQRGLLQFTSGSTGHPRGVRISRASLEANVHAMTSRIGFTGEDGGCATWLPLYHDMGLIGCLLSVITQQGNLSILRPDQFIRDPLRWLECFGRGEASFTAAPTFGFAYAAKRVTASEIAQLDFSGWRAIVVGAERVGAGPLRRFADLLEPRGFDLSVFAPAYGLAEATLAVTMSEAGQVPRAVQLDWSALSVGSPVELTDQAALDHAGSSANPAEWLVGCGRPVDGVSVSLVDEGGDPVEPGCLGEILVEGTSVGDGYEDSADEPSARFVDGRLRTGDAGFLHDGELYVLGRIGDALSIGGRNLYMEDLEARLAEIDGVPKARCVVVAGPTEVVAVVEAPPGEWTDAAEALLVRQVGHATAVRVVSAARGTIPRTSSGKPRRRELWRRLAEDHLGGETVSRHSRRDAAETVTA